MWNKYLQFEKLIHKSSLLAWVVLFFLQSVAVGGCWPAGHSLTLSLTHVTLFSSWTVAGPVRVYYYNYYFYLIYLSCLICVIESAAEYPNAVQPTSLFLNPSKFCEKYLTLFLMVTSFDPLFMICLLRSLVYS